MAGEAAYDMMLACVPGRGHQHLLEGDQCHLRMTSLPTVEEVECEQDGETPQFSSPDAKSSECPEPSNSWASLMQSARPLRREIMNAIEDTKEQLAIEDGPLALEDSDGTVTLEGNQLDDGAKSEDGVQVEKPSSSKEVKAEVLPPEHNDGVKADDKPSKEVNVKKPPAKKRARAVPTASNENEKNLVMAQVKQRSTTMTIRG